MNKSELTNKLLNSNQLLSKIDVEDSINHIIDLISSSLSANKRLEIRGFGTFSTRKRPKRISRNPKTGAFVSVEEKRHPYFRASKALKESLKNQK